MEGGWSRYVNVTMCCCFVSNQDVTVKIPSRIVPLLPGVGQSKNGVWKRQTCNITSVVFTKTDVRGSHFHQCWKAYIQSNPGDEDLKSLFEIGRFDMKPEIRTRLTVTMLTCRVKFTKEVVRRGEPLLEVFLRHNDDKVSQCIPP